MLMMRHAPVSTAKAALAHADDGFIKADRGAQFFLQARVIVDVVVPQWLLDHEQIELVELAQVLDLIERVGRVGVTTERDIGPARADAFEHIQIPARLDFDLDAAIAGGKFGLDFLEQLLD